ncbi:MAG: hypothetical protein NTW67_00005 [Candidatus Woesearchaeota archaeon]|nr:hypothetical protein [Candidatus Woesearchaeota archaeon]
MMKQRPILISILAVLSIIGGILLAILLPVFILAKDAMAEGLALFEIPFWFLIFSLLFLTALSLAGGIGMWKGTKWGWWLAQFSFVFDIFRRLFALINTMAITDEVPTKMYLRAIGAIVNILFIWYFFKPDVLAYFNMQKIKKIKAMLIIIGINIAFVIISTALAYLTYR